MSLVVIGINNRTMPLDLFERFAIQDDGLPKAIADVIARRNVSEAIVLSTCNRLEVYVYAEKFHGAYQDVRDFLTETAGVAPEEFNDYLYAHYEHEAISHLFSVTSGLDSAIVGENQVQHQVKVAWERAREEGACGTVINSAFRRALEVGKRVRTETNVGEDISSISQACVELAQRSLGGFADRKVLVVGAGEVSDGVANSLKDAGASEIYFVNRSFDRAEALANMSGGHALPYEELNEILKEVDVLISATAANSYILNQKQVQEVMSSRAGRELLMVDIAVPRDVDPQVAHLDGVTLIDIDTLWSSHSHTALIGDNKEYVKALTIIQEELNRFLEDQSARQVAPLIAGFRNGAEEIRQAELKRFASQLSDLTDEQRELVESLTQGILGKLLHDPTVSLSEAAGSPRGERLADALRELFNL